MHTNRIQNSTLNVKLAYTGDHCITSKQSGVQCKECDSKDVMQKTDMHSELTKKTRDRQKCPELPEKSPELPENCPELPDNLAKSQKKN